MMQVTPRSGSRKVNGYVKAVLALVERAHHTLVPTLALLAHRFADRRRDQLAAEVTTRLRALSGGQLAAAQRLLAMITQATASDGTANRG